MRSARCAAILMAALLQFVTSSAHSATLWEIGKPDNYNAEFAFAPKGYESIQQDAFFVIGESNPKVDWPYAQAGPGDAWAGSKSHNYTILFGLKAAPVDGTCTLRLDFIDAQHSHAPHLRVLINGRPFEKKLGKGAGDQSIYGEPAKGREQVWEIPFSVSILKGGANEISISTIGGCWVLYDFISLDAPAGLEIAPIPPETQVTQVELAPVWLKDGEKTVQPITVGIRHFGKTGSASLQAGNAKPLLVQLRNGTQTVEVRVPAREQTRKETLRVLFEGREIATKELTIAPPPIREMWLLPHSHVDIGYTHRQEEIVEVQISNLKTAMKLARQTATNPPGMRFKWNPEAVWSLDHFLQRATAEEKQEFIEAVRRGEIGVDGLYGNLLTGLCRPEELAQGLAFGARLSNLTGVPVESASICDVPGWTWGIVPIMAKAGVKYFAIGPNFRDRVGTIHVWDNKPFYWRSQSGRERVLCWVVDNYHFFGDLEPHVLAHVRKLREMKFSYDTSFMFWVGRGPGGSVDNAPPDEETAKKALAWNAKYAAPKIIIGLAGEYFRTFERRHGSKVPEFAGDLTPYWEDGAGSTSKETAMNRASADRLSQAETVFAMRQPETIPTEAFDQAWKNVLLYSEHTWGAWCSISKPDDAFTKDQWRVKQAFALDADHQSRKLLNAALSGGSSGGPTASFDVINTTQWRRTDLVVVPEEFAGKAILDAQGRGVACQKLASGEWVFVAEEVPAFGSRHYRVGTSRTISGEAALPKTQNNELVLDNGLVRVEVDGNTGAIKSLWRAGFDHEFVDPNAPVGLNDFRYVLGTDAAGAQKNGPVNIQVLDHGPVVFALRIESEAPGCNKLTRDIRLIQGLDRVEIINNVDRKSVREKDGVHFGFGFHVPEGKIHMETPWAVVRPNLDQLPGSCRNWFTVQRWTEIANGSCGVTWASLDAPLMQIGGITANLLGSVEFHEWMTNALESQTIYSWAQNNHWHTNYKVDQPGVTTFRYLLRPHSGSYSAAESARFGMETTRPLLVASAARSVEPQQLLELSSDDVLVESIKPSVDRKAVIVQLFGMTDEAQTIRLNWKKPAKALYETDLTEKPLRKMRDGVRVPAFGVVHLRADF